jgi:hypothetical protein
LVNAGWQEFEGDEATKLRVLSQVDDTHPATAHLAEDAVVRNGLADELGWSDH